MALTLNEDDLTALATAVGVLRDTRPPARQPSPFFLRLVDTLTVDPSELFGPITIEERP